MPAQAGIQYAAAYRLYRCDLWDTGKTSAFANDDQ